MKRKQYSWSGHHQRDDDALLFVCLVLMVLIGVSVLLAHWLNF